MDNIMNKPVDVICYGTCEHFETRKEARDKYAEAMAACEGAEQERYVKIYIALAHGAADVVTDGDPERAENGSLVKFTVADKDEIIDLITRDIFYINSPEIYDRGACKLVVEDRDIIKALLKQDGWYAAQSLRKYIANDKELLLEAAHGGDGERGALAYASDELQDDKKFVFAMLECDASDFRYVSERLSNDIETVAKAFQCAKTEYDFDCIKECLGKDLLTEMVKGHLDKQQEKNTKEEIVSNIVLDEQNNSLAEKIAAAESVKASDDKASSNFFDVTITETLKMTVQVEADSLEEAEQMVSDNWHNQDYILDAENFVGVEFTGKPAREKNKEFDARDER